MVEMRVSILLVFISHVVFSQNNQIDDFEYNYPSQSNQLYYVNDNVDAANWAMDIDPQASTNYAYNAMGQLTKDEAEGIDTIYWNLQGLVKRVVKSNGNTLNFSYNISDQRIKKEIISGDTIYQTLYSRYPDGNISAVYEKKFKNGEEASATINLKELNIESKSRVGIVSLETSIQSYINVTNTYKRELENKSYELTNHLADVKVSLADKINATYKSGVLKKVGVTIETATNYYAYGMQEPGRYYSMSTYRYGVQGKENDTEIKGDGNSYDFGARMLDPRVGRWLSTDPWEYKYVSLSPYNAFANNPIRYVDPTGKGVGEAIENIADQQCKDGDAWWNYSMQLAADPLGGSTLSPNTLNAAVPAMRAGISYFNCGFYNTAAFLTPTEEDVAMDQALAGGNPWPHDDAAAMVPIMVANRIPKVANTGRKAAGWALENISNSNAYRLAKAWGVDAAVDMLKKMGWDQNKIDNAMGFTTLKSKEAYGRAGEVMGSKIENGQLHIQYANGSNLAAGQEDMFDFVITLDGQLLIGDGHALLSQYSERVLSAGGIVVNGSGEIIEITNRSGHYMPTTAGLNRAIEYFESVGVDMSSAKKVDLPKTHNGQ